MNESERNLKDEDESIDNERAKKEKKNNQK